MDSYHNMTNLKDPLYIINGSGGCLEGLEWDAWYNRGIDWNYMVYNSVSITNYNNFSP